MEKIYSRTKTIQEDKVSGFCPGCMHSTVIKLIGEVLDEMNLVIALPAFSASAAVVCTWIISPTIPPPRPMAAPAPWPPA